MEFRVRNLQPSDAGTFVALIKLFQSAFEMGKNDTPSTHYLQTLLKRDDFFVFVAENLETEVVGGITAYLLRQYYTGKPTLYIYDLAVARDHRRKGIGKQLIETVRKHAVALGAGEIFVQAHSDDIDAVRFYNSTGAATEEVLHFTYRV